MLKNEIYWILNDVLAPILKIPYFSEMLTIKVFDFFCNLISEEELLLYLYLNYDLDLHFRPVVQEFLNLMTKVI